MKKLFLLSLVVLFFAGLGYADGYVVKEKFHTDGFYASGMNTPPLDIERDMFVTSKKVAIVEKARKVIFEKDKNTLTLVDLVGKTYFQFKLPLDAAKIRDPQLTQILTAYKFNIKVTPTGKSKKIGKYKCDEYKVVTWMSQGEMKINEDESIMYATKDVPFDYNLRDTMAKNVFAFLATDDAILKEIGKVTGCTIKSDSARMNEGVTVKSSRQLVDVKKMAPPKGTFDIPEGFKKKEKFGLPDLRLFISRI